MPIIKYDPRDIPPGVQIPTEKDATKEPVGLLLVLKRTQFVTRDFTLLRGMTYIVTRVIIPNTTILTLSYFDKNGGFIVKGTLEDRELIELMENKAILALPKSYLKKLINS